MTALLYRNQQEARTFEARIVQSGPDFVVLDRTLFYPEGGGQPADRGTIAWPGGVVKVSDVRREGEIVRHILPPNSAVIPEDTSVVGTLDWSGRFRHMQRHSAEHLLAQAFLRVSPAFGVQAVSMRGPDCTIDLLGDPTEEDALMAERLVGDVIAQDLPIRVQDVPEEELHLFPLRRPPKVRGEIRLVTVVQDDGTFWEVSACGGTHVSSTARVAPVVILRLERIRGHLTRVVFRAGEEAAELLTQTYRTARGLALTFSTGVEQLSERVHALQQDHRSALTELAQTRQALSTQLVRHGERTRRGEYWLRVISLDDEALAQPVLHALLNESTTVGIVTCSSGRVGLTSTVPNVQAGSLLRSLLSEAGGRGGGRDDVAQGQADPARWSPVLDRWLQDALT